MDYVHQADQGKEGAGFFPSNPAWNWLAQLLHESSIGAPNRAGKVFTFDEFRRLLTRGWDRDGDLCLAEFMVWRFCAITILLGALPPSVLNLG